MVQQIRESPFCVFKGRRTNLNHDVFLSMKIVFNITNSEDYDVLQHYAAFYSDLYCLPK